MKKFEKLALLVITLGSIGIISNPISADTNKTPEQSVNELFVNLKDTDKVTPLPNGAFVRGEAEVIKGEDFNKLPENSRTKVSELHKISKTYDSNSNEAITVAQAKKTMVNNIKKDIALDNETKSNPTLKGSFPPDPATSYRVLIAGEVYNSQKFSSNGWQFSGMVFLNKGASHGVNGWLDWKTNVDSGTVGDSQDMYNIYYLGWATSGIIIYPGNGYKRIYPTTGQWLAYATYKAKAGTTYSVRGTGIG